MTKEEKFFLHIKEEIAKLENQVEDLKSDRASSERENTKLQAKIRQMES